MTYFGVDISTDDEVGFPRDLLDNQGECLEELFVWGIVAGMVDRFKKEGEWFPFDLPPLSVKAANF